VLGYGVFIGLLGNAAMNAPLYTYISRWFDRRRGTALALLGSGFSVSAAVWAPIFAASEAQFGWRNTMLCFAAIEVALILPAALLMLGPAPEQPGAAGTTTGRKPPGPVLGLRPRTALAMLAAAGFCCYMPMAMPQGHLARTLQRCRYFDVGRRGDAVDAARPCVRQPAVLGGCRRPDRRTAHRPGRLGLPACSNGGISSHPERDGLLSVSGSVASSRLTY
jgi:hypothetical protein